VLHLSSPDKANQNGLFDINIFLNFPSVRFRLYFFMLRRPLAVWLAVWIAVFGALAPTVSHALVWAQGDNGAWTEICTPTSTRWVKLGLAPNDAPQSLGTTAIQIQTDSPGGPESAPSLKCCPFCLLALDRAAPPSNPLVCHFAVSGEYALPTIRQTFFYVTPFALTPPLRGPPHLS
jgi:hypothetical protein